MADIIIHRFMHERPPHGGLKQTIGTATCEDFTCACIERPKVKGIKSVSRIPEGEYPYRIINKTPTCSMAYIKIDDSEFVIEVVDSYVDANRKIIFCEYPLFNETHYEGKNQRNALMEICKRAPEQGTIQFLDCFDD